MMRTLLETTILPSIDYARPPKNKVCMTDSPDSTSMTLLEKVRHQEPQAWGRFTSIYRPLIFYWCVHCSKLSAEDAEDVTQDVFMSVSKAIGDFRRDREGDSLRGWLRVITTNQIRNHLSRKVDKIQASGGTSAQILLRQVSDLELPADDATESGILIRRAVEVLKTHFSESTFQAFWMLVIEGKPTDSIAKELELTPQAIRQACYRVRRKLRQDLGELLETDTPPN